MPLHLAWVKAHIGVGGNDWADKMAKEGCRAIGDSQVTEGGVRALLKRLRVEEVGRPVLKIQMGL